MKMFILLISAFLVTGTSLFPADSSDDANVLNNKTQLLSLKNVMLLESEYEPGRYTTGELPGAQLYDGKFLPRSASIQKRMYTFKTTFKIDESLNSEDLAFYLGPSVYPYDIYVNDIKIIKRGIHGEKYNAPVNFSAVMIIPGAVLKYGKTQSNTFLLQAYPDHQIYALGTVMISGFEAASYAAFVRTLLNVNFFVSFPPISLVLCLYFISLFIMRRFKDTKYLYFALMCLFFSFATYYVISYHDAAREFIDFKISRIGFTGFGLFLTLYTIEFTGIFAAKKWLKLFIFTLFSITLGALLVQTSLAGVEKLFAVITNVLFLPFLIFNLIITVISAVKNRKIDMIIYLSSYLIVFMATIHDTYNFSRSITPFCWLSPYGFFSLLVSSFVILAVEQNRIYLSAETNAKKLEIRNNDIVDLNTQLEKSNDSLNVTNSHLENVVSCLKERTEELNQYKHNLEEIVQLRTSELTKTNESLSSALGEVKTLKGFLPICSSCKKIRDDEGYWQQIEDYIRKHSDAEFSHGICPDCVKKLYPDLPGGEQG